MSALDAARHHAAEVDETSGAIRHSHLTAVQAYATLALAEALTALPQAATTYFTGELVEDDQRACGCPSCVYYEQANASQDDVRDETLYEFAQELVADLLQMDDAGDISLAAWPAAKALVGLIRPAALVDLVPVPFVPADHVEDDHAASDYAPDGGEGR